MPAIAAKIWDDGLVDGPVVFRISPLGLIAVVTLAVCVMPVAVSARGMLVLFLIPIGLVYWIVRVRTTVDADAVVARGILHTRRVAWTDITALRLRTRSRVSAVLANGAELPLPAVHVRDLPLLSSVSGGRLPDPSPASKE
ncbi:PH domain-containing protein [Pseudonocardia acaciae]|uniref:PH domain-containing protein n=1 Tax=Pseudonocardia acaciae TaxID=551276 RepID=UPI000A75D60B|nr:PH domain-containing protein [Pseudonocardia acaciae]